MKNIENIIKLLDESIKEDAELNIMGGGIILDGYDEEVDYFRGLIGSSQDWLINYQNELTKNYGLSSLKIKYTNALGYFIEVPKSQISKIPDIFIHKQTLVNASRYITIELKKFEEDILGAEGKKAEREYELFLNIREKILDNFNEIKNISDKIGFIDFEVGLAEVAYNFNYIKPKLDKNIDLKILGGRHPVIEQNEKDFISNDLILNTNDFIHIITGPNMGGKSTYLRQNALIVLMSHIGSFIPAKSAKIPLTDKIFSRVGANDNLFLGESTFMVEMKEVANILNNSTKNSFVIIDEVGRGTSTYDGMSLAWAILKDLHDNIGVKTLFATHYHELIDKSKKLKGVSNFSVAVGENEDNLVFLRKIIPGGIKKSFGLEVAKIAGLSNLTIAEAKKMLKELEVEHNSKGAIQMCLSEPIIEYIEKESIIENEIKKIDLNNLTPIGALNLIYKFKNKINEK
ncbi:DNA mismatch repair protein MutS [Candidatus Gracilibacteria bacterium]|nr:DNA mismatch repair protein MutS [Candidatus Gracilibacteria bacterium]